MSRADLVNNGFFFIVAFLALLLLMCLYAVIALSPEDSVRTEPPTLRAPTQPPRAARPQLRPATALAGDAGRSGAAGYAARHATAAAPVTNRPKVSGRPPWGPAPRPPGLDR